MIEASGQQGMYPIRILSWVSGKSWKDSRTGMTIWSVGVNVTDAESDNRKVPFLKAEETVVCRSLANTESGNVLSLVSGTIGRACEAMTSARDKISRNH